MTLPAATRGFLSQPALTRLWDVIARRLERNGLAARGRLGGAVTVGDLARRGAHPARSRLIGRAHV